MLGRAGHRCQGPGCAARGPSVKLDAHHITNRNLMPAGGYVAENGIALCDTPGGCHEKAEAVDHGELVDPRFTASALYRIIGSSPEAATAASERLAAGTYEPPRARPGARRT
ncbi:Hypothetical protein A7982_06509 [Minicystis rosea]|nr:Hypothetical protein A7982_06509 [Minicystis rosea]